VRGGGGGGGKWYVCLVKARRVLILGLGAEGAKRGRRAPMQFVVIEVIAQSHHLQFEFLA
jgi:hypothetical protein